MDCCATAFDFLVYVCWRRRDWKKTASKLTGINKLVWFILGCKHICLCDVYVMNMSAYVMFEVWIKRLVLCIRYGHTYLPMWCVEGEHICLCDVKNMKVYAYLMYRVWTNMLALEIWKENWWEKMGKVSEFWNWKLNWTSKLLNQRVNLAFFMLDKLWKLS